MSDIRVTSTGKPFYQIDSAVAAVLLEAFPASFEKIEPKPTHNVAPKTSPTAPRWVVRKHPLNGKPELVLVVMNQEHRYPGTAPNPSAESAQAAFSAAGHPVPADVLEEFGAMLKNYVAAPSADQVAAARQQAINDQYVQQQREAEASLKLEHLG